MYQFHSYDNSEAPLFKTDARDAPENLRRAVCASHRAVLENKAYIGPEDALRRHKQQLWGIAFVFPLSEELYQYIECVERMCQALIGGLHSVTTPAKAEQQIQSGA